MAPRLELEVSETVMMALAARSERTGEPISELVDQLLSTSLELERHALFQVSTSNALVQGVFDSPVTVGELKRHGDFGLGTFEGLDGELILLDGDCLRATAGGVVTIPDDDQRTPFAVVCEFNADVEADLGSVVSGEDLKTRLDEMRPSGNLFAGVRGDGLFEQLSLRAACRAEPGEGLVEATSHQSEFEATACEGTLVGFWAPQYARSVAVPGYHFHFISSDQKVGGHVLDLSATDLSVGLHIESDLHVALPESEEFLAADLTGDHAAALDKAETSRKGA